MPGFYSETPEPCLLLGDVVQGFRCVVPHLHAPGGNDGATELGITVTRPEYFAVLTPCCSIGNKQISLAPLVKIRLSFFNNPYFVEDFARINDLVPPDKTLSPADWERLDPERKRALLEQGPSYSLGDNFIYAEDPRLRRYEVKGKGATVHHTGCWLLEFGSAFRINCDKVTRNAAAPEGVKFLELSVIVREQLRRKLQHYFGRTPEEDRAALTAGT